MFLASECVCDLLIWILGPEIWYTRRLFLHLRVYPSCCFDLCLFALLWCGRLLPFLHILYRMRKMFKKVKRLISRSKSRKKKQWRHRTLLCAPFSLSIRKISSLYSYMHSHRYWTEYCCWQYIDNSLHRVELVGTDSSRNQIYPSAGPIHHCNMVDISCFTGSGVFYVPKTHE